MRMEVLLAFSLCWAVSWAAEPDTPADLLGDPLPPGASARLGTARFRTSGDVAAVAVSPDGRWVAWGGESGLRVCESATGKLVFPTTDRGDDEEAVHAIEFSSDGRWLLSGGDTEDLCLWDLKTWNVRTLKGHESTARHVTFSRNGQQAASCDEDGVLILWDIAQGIVLRKFSSDEENISAVAFSHDGRQLACGLDEGRLKLLDVQNLNALLTVEGHGQSVKTLTFSPDGSRLATAGDDSTVRVWEARELRPVWAGETNNAIDKVLFSKDGATVFTADEDGYIQLWDATTGQSKRRFLTGGEPGETSLYAMALSPDEKTLYCGGDAPYLCIMDVETGRPVERCAGHQEPPRQLTFSPDSQTLASGSMDGTMRVWDVATGRQKFVRHVATGWESHPVFSTDNKRVACAGLQVLHIWDAESGMPLAFGRGAPNAVQHMICCPDGRGPLTFSGDRLALWSFEDGRALPVGTPPEEAPPGGESDSNLVDLKVAFDGRTLFAAGNKIRCIDLSTGKDFTPEGFDLQPPLAVSGDGRWLVGNSPDGPAIYEAASLKKVLALDLRGEASDVPLVFSPDNRFLLVCSNAERHAVLLDTFTRKKVGALSAGDGHFISAERSPDGRWLALGHSDTTILVFRWETLLQKVEPQADATENLDATYEALAGEPEKAFEAIGRFLHAGKAGIDYLDAKLQPVRADPATVETLVAELNNDDFTVREKATVSLLGLGLLAESHLRKTRAESQQLEVQKRVDAILQDLALPLVRSKELLRNLRVIGILENANSKESRAALEKRKGGEAGSVEGQAINAALQRMSRRHPATPR